MVIDFIYVVSCYSRNLPIWGKYDLENVKMKEIDMIQLIQAFEAFDNINELVIELTGGYQIEGEKYCALFGIGDIIKRNSKYISDDDVTCQRFWDIMYDKNIPVLSKYELLKTE